jgi:hypothetical protein
MKRPLLKNIAHFVGMIILYCFFQSCVDDPVHPINGLEVTSIQQDTIFANYPFYIYGKGFSTFKILAVKFDTILQKNVQIINDTTLKVDAPDLSTGKYKLSFILEKDTCLTTFDRIIYNSPVRDIFINISYCELEYNDLLFKIQIENGSTTEDYKSTLAKFKVDGVSTSTTGVSLTQPSTLVFYNLFIASISEALIYYNSKNKLFNLSTNLVYVRKNETWTMDYSNYKFSANNMEFKKIDEKTYSSKITGPDLMKKINGLVIYNNYRSGYPSKRIEIRSLYTLINANDNSYINFIVHLM